MGSFDELFQEGKIGSLKIRNRIVMPPMGTNYADEKGFVTERLKNYYEARAKGGAGLCIVEIISVDSPCGNSLVHNLSLHSDEHIPGMKGLVSAIKRHGARAAAQLFHAGVETHRRVTGLQPVGPSVVRTFSGDQPRELDIDEISELIKRFAEAAVRAKRAGFDAVEIHGATYYLIAQFLSRHWNKRKDHYGGPLENRVRFLIQVLRAVREAVGKEFPVWCRINGSEFGIDEALTLDEAKKIAQLAEEAGADAVHVSSLGGGSEPHMGPTVLDPGVLLPLAKEIKKGIRIPVIAVGRIDPVQAREAIAKGDVDFVSIGRGLIADPELPQKLKEGREEDIRPCIGCLECINHIIYRMEPLRCSVNAICGREGEYKITPSATRKDVVVIGGGPGGMEAARVSALRGHKVTLFDRESSLGGLLVSASIPPKKEDINRLTRYLKAQVERTGVKVFLRREVRPEEIASMGPDAVIVASGGSPYFPEIEGLKEAGPILAEDAILERRQTGRRVIILGGGMVGLETADYLSERGKEVYVLEVLERMAHDMMPIMRRLVLDRLRKKGVFLLPGIKEERIEGKRLHFRERDGKREAIDFDTVIIAAGRVPAQGAWEELRAAVPELYFAGDVTGSRGILDAISAGNAAGRQV